MDCGTCEAVAGDILLTNAPRLELDEHWRVEHCYPVGSEGWLVLVLRRHARALHDLTADEGAALGHWLPRLVKALHQATGCELEYVMQFAEAEGHHHVHFHLVARHHAWPDEWRGPRVFAAMQADDPIDAGQATRVIEAVGAELGVRPAPLTR
jgi:diadenosine tetraphosphate (Ap4A) HIT family hydrolase